MREMREMREREQLGEGEGWRGRGRGKGRGRENNKKHITANIPLGQTDKNPKNKHSTHAQHNNTHPLTH